jgi:hypothetical protein
VAFVVLADDMQQLFAAQPFIATIGNEGSSSAGRDRNLRAKHRERYVNILQKGFELRSAVVSNSNIFRRCPKLVQ